ncbi:MAG: response regulator [Opitutaceae bacterium]|nr:response regulator [Opitutaceae bacterium]
MLSPLRLLHLEDCESDAELIRRLLLREWPDCIVTRLDRPDTLPAVLRAQSIDLVLSDLPHASSGEWDVPRQMRAADPEMPLVVLSDSVDEGVIVEALQAGAADYVFKERPTRLIPAIRRALENARSRRDQSRTERLLHNRLEAVEKAQDAICITDAHGHVTYANECAREMFALSGDQDPPGLEALFGFQNRSALSAAFVQLHAVGFWAGKFPLSLPNAQARFIVSRWTLIRDSENRPNAILSISTDITDHKKLEGRLLPPRQHEGLSSFADGIAQDLNQVLKPILMAAIQLQRRIDERGLLHLVDIIYASSRHGLSLLNQVQAYADGVENDRQEVKPGLLIQEVVSLLREAFSDSVNIETVIQKNLWSISANSTQLSQILINLGLHARDAMVDAGVLTFRACNIQVDATLAQATPGARPGPHVLITVSDTGAGIPPELMDRVFDPRLPEMADGYDRVPDLSTVRGIVQGIGGFLQVESTQGMGTEFILHLPAMIEADDADALALQPFVRTIDGRGETVLLIDEESGARDLVQTFLESHGYRVFVAGNAVAALKVFQDRHHDVQIVLTDAIMADAERTDLVSRIQGMKPDIRIIAMGGGSAETESTSSVAGVSYFPKPLTGHALLVAVRQVLAGT